MSTFGEQQNNIEGLPRVSVSDYERIFKVHTDNVDGKNFHYYNILQKIEFPENINTNFIAYHKVEGSMPLTTLAHQIYGNIKMWWIIFLLNKPIFRASMFTVPTGVSLKYIKPEALPVIYGQITRQTVYNGRHF